GMDHWATASFTNPLAERFQHGIIRFLAAEPFDTLPANYCQIRTPASRLLERINECCLPDPRLPVTKTTCRCPSNVLLSASPNLVRALSRPTISLVALVVTSEAAEAISSCTGAIN